LALRQRIEAALPRPQAAPNRRAVLRGFAMGSAVSALAATGLVAIVLRRDDVERIQSEVVSAHLRSLQAGHLTDVVSTDQHTVKPWFNGKLDVAPPVIDLTAQGFTLVGGRLDYVDARAIGAVVYKRRQHIINLFVAQTANTERRSAKIETVQGFNIRHWSDRGLNYWAVSDLASDELAEFGEKFEATARTHREGSRRGRALAHPPGATSNRASAISPCDSAAARTTGAAPAHRAPAPPRRNMRSPTRADDSRIGQRARRRSGDRKRRRPAPVSRPARIPALWWPWQEARQQRLE